MGSHEEDSLASPFLCTEFNSEQGGTEKTRSGDGIRAPVFLDRRCLLAIRDRLSSYEEDPLALLFIRAESESEKGGAETTRVVNGVGAPVFLDRICLSFICDGLRSRVVNGSESEPSLSSEFSIFTSDGVRSRGGVEAEGPYTARSLGLLQVADMNCEQKVPFHDGLRSHEEYSLVLPFLCAE